MRARWLQMLTLLLPAVDAASVGGIRRDTSCPLARIQLEHGGGFATNLEQPQSVQGMVNCSWYAQSTCCSAEDTLRITHTDHPEISLAGALTRGCRDSLTLLGCASCSPDQRLLFAQESVRGFDVAVLRTCESFCDRLYRTCGEASLVLAGGRTDRVDALFGTGLAFCQAVGLRAIPKVDHAVCFSPAVTWRRGPLVMLGRGGGSLLVAATAAASLLWLRRTGTT